MTKANSRNEALYQAIMEIWPSVSSFCKQFRLHPTIIGKLINLQMCPLSEKGDYRPLCRRLSEILGIGLDDLFPLKLYGQNPPLEFQDCTKEELVALGLSAQDPVISNLQLLKKVEGLSRKEKIKLARQLKKK